MEDYLAGTVFLCPSQAIEMQKRYTNAYERITSHYINNTIVTIIGRSSVGYNLDKNYKIK